MNLGTESLRTIPIKSKSTEENKSSNILKILLFWSTFILVIFLGRRIFGAPGGNPDFIVKNLLSFGIAIIFSGIMLHFLGRKLLMIGLLIIWCLIILLIAICPSCWLAQGDGRKACLYCGIRLNTAVH